MLSLIGALATSVSLKGVNLIAGIASLAKKTLKDLRAFILQNTCCDIASVIQGGHLQEVDHTSCGPGGWICAAKNHASYPSVNDRACAHRAWLLGHVQIAIGQSPVTHPCFSLRQCQHFRMRGGVLEQLDLIMSARDNFARANNNSTDRHFVGFACL